MIIPENFAQVNFLFAGDSAPTGAEVTLGLFNISSKTADAVAQDARDAWILNLLPLQASSISIVGCESKLGPNSTGANGFGAAASAGGTSGGSEVPNVSILVRKITSAGGRAGRGRMFIPGVVESQFDSAGIMSPTSAGTWNDALADFHAALVAADLLPRLLHSAGSPLATPTEIDSFAVDGRAATQRRRLRR